MPAIAGCAPNYAGSLRAYLRSQATVETLVDVGDNRVFADAPDVYPAVLVVRKSSPPAGYTAQAAVFTCGEGVKQFAAQVAAKLAPVSIHDQPDTGWQLGDDAGRRVFAKLMAGGRPLGEVVGGRIYRGILTGLNEAFIVDQATRDRIVKADPACATIIKPMVNGEDVRSWHLENEGRWLILLPDGWTDAHFGIRLSEGIAWQQLQETFPALTAHLAPFAEAARQARRTRARSGGNCGLAATTLISKPLRSSGPKWRSSLDLR